MVTADQIAAAAPAVAALPPLSEEQVTLVALLRHHGDPDTAVRAGYLRVARHAAGALPTCSPVTPAPVLIARLVASLTSLALLAGVLAGLAADTLGALADTTA